MSPEPLNGKWNVNNNWVSKEVISDVRSAVEYFDERVLRAYDECIKGIITIQEFWLEICRSKRKAFADVMGRGRMNTRECLQLLQEMGWLKSPFSDMELDTLEFQFNEDAYIIHSDGFEVKE